MCPRILCPFKILRLSSEPSPDLLRRLRAGVALGVRPTIDRLARPTYARSRVHLVDPAVVSVTLSTDPDVPADSLPLQDLAVVLGAVAGSRSTSSRRPRASVLSPEFAGTIRRSARPWLRC